MSPGQSPMDNPDPSWIETNVWGEIKALCGIGYFKDFASVFAQRTAAWRRSVRCGVGSPAAFVQVSHAKLHCRLVSRRLQHVLASSDDGSPEGEFFEVKIQLIEAEGGGLEKVGGVMSAREPLS